MSDSQDIEVSLLKVAVSSLSSMLLFAIMVLIFAGLARNSMLVVVVTVIVVIMTPVFTGCFYFMLRSKINHEGLRSAVPWGFTRVLRWEDIIYVRGNWPFYVVRGRKLEDICLLPYGLFLKQPRRLSQLIEQYAPEDNILRRRLGR